MINSIEIPCCIIPMSDRSLMLPNSSIAEILVYDPNNMNTSKREGEYLLGLYKWREHDVPCISCYYFTNQAKATKEERIAIIKAISEEKTFQYYGLVFSDLPRLVKVKEKQLVDEKKAIQKKFQPHTAVFHNGEKILIPDLLSFENNFASICLK